MEERRSTQRFRLALPIQVTFWNSHGPKLLMARLRDISTRGLYFLFEQAPPDGMPVEITLALPNGVPGIPDILVRAAVKLLRQESLPGGQEAGLGMAASIEHFEILSARSTSAA